MPWLECVPNVSEGRDAARIDHLAATLSATPGVSLLDVHRDGVHHRSVFTLVGESTALTTAVVALCREALETIDLRRHDGMHPRIGAVDVVPFIPLGESTMDDAVAAARATGDAIASAFAVPVWLYEAAATAPERRRLEVVRRGRFEGLAAKLASPGWQPDFGPARPHPSFGAVAVGARRLLVAFNINLATTRLDVAETIARTVRTSGGGLPHVKAMGVALPERRLVQVSMNLTNVDETPMGVVYDAVAREAAGHGVTIAESELVGLVPAAALPRGGAAALRLVDWHPDRVLDTRLATLASQRTGTMSKARIFL